jgi:alpha-amylase
VVKCKQGYSLVQNGTGGLSAAFDFTTKGILQEAVKGEWWRLCDLKAKPSGVLGW